MMDDSYSDVGRTPLRQRPGRYAGNIPESYNVEDQEECRQLEAQMQAMRMEHELDRVELGLGGKRPQRYKSDSGSKALQRVLPSKFTGTSDWECYIVKFNFIARAHDWDDNDKVLAIVSQLEGDALQVFRQLSWEEQNSFQSICDAMANQFAPLHDTGLYMNLISQKQQGKDETIEALARDIAKLARRAYPTSDKMIYESVCVNHFINALSDQQLRTKLREHFPLHTR